MKTRTAEQLAKLGILMGTIEFPKGTIGYTKLFTAIKVDEATESDWLNQIEKFSPGITEQYRKIA